eukprot:scaffold358384_cov45-Prasinocladus_malaysianus.AAC.1
MFPGCAKRFVNPSVCSRCLEVRAGEEPGDARSRAVRVETWALLNVEVAEVNISGRPRESRERERRKGVRSEIRDRLPLKRLGC